MRLNKIEMVNFRQFYGRQSVEFSRDKNQNVTVIHGANGSGKTTILNAFLWLFYDDITLPKNDKIASERAMAEVEPNGTVEVQVRLLFTHDNIEYTATRSKTVRRTHTGDFTGTEVRSDIHLEYVDEVGNRKERGNASDSLQNILPNRLREIFFFDGETIDELSKIGSQEKIQTAIQNMMGLTRLERAQKHLETVRKRFENEVSRYSSTEITTLYDKRNKLKNQKESLSDELENIRNSKAHTKDELKKVEQRLSELEDSRNLQKEREQLEEGIENIETRVDQINSNISARISDAGYVPFAAPALEQTAKMLKKKRDKGEIPSEIKTQFVNDLLEVEECICGRELVPKTESYQRVKHWRQKAGSSELEKVAMNITSRLTEIGEEEEKIYQDVTEMLDQRSDLTDKIQQKQERVSEISHNLEKADTEDVSRLEQRRQKLSQDVSDYDQQIGTTSGQIKRHDEKINEVTGEINEVEEQNKKAELAQRRAQMADCLKDYFEELFEDYQDEVRKNVNQRVNNIFRDIIVKEYYAEIGEDYSLRILKNIGSNETIPVAKSTGERQVASLAFIASLVSIARDQYQSQDDLIHSSGGIYPIIMDSPFGSLDPEYQKRVSAVLPKMAEQVVVMVTQSQWSTEVAGEIDTVAGQRHYLKYHDPSSEEVEYEHTEIIHRNGGRY